MVFAELLELARASPINAAVTHVRGPRAVCADQQRYTRGSHAGELGILERLAEDVGVGGCERAVQKFFGFRIILFEDGPDGLHRDATRVLTARVSSQAVRHHQQSIAAGRELAAAILVDGAHAPDVAMRPGFDFADIDSTHRTKSSSRLLGQLGLLAHSAPVVHDTGATAC